MKHAELRKSKNTKTSKNNLPTVMLSDTSDAPCTGSILPKVQEPESHLHPLNTIKSVFKVKEILILNSISTADDLQKSLQARHVELPGASR